MCIFVTYSFVEFVSGLTMPKRNRNQHRSSKETRDRRSTQHRRLPDPNLTTDVPLPLVILMAMYMMIDQRNAKSEYYGGSEYEEMVTLLTQFNTPVPPSDIIVARRLTHMLTSEQKYDIICKLDSIVRNMLYTEDREATAAELIRASYKPYSTDIIEKEVTSFFQGCELYIHGKSVDMQVEKGFDNILFDVAPTRSIQDRDGNMSQTPLSGACIMHKLETSVVENSSQTEPMLHSPGCDLRAPSPLLVVSTCPVDASGHVSSPVMVEKRSVCTQSHAKQLKIRVAKKVVPRDELISRIRFFNHLPFANIQASRHYRRAQRDRILEQRICRKLTKDIYRFVMTSISAAGIHKVCSDQHERLFSRTPSRRAKNNRGRARQDSDLCASTSQV